MLVTDSGAGPPLERLYLIPKSFSGPCNCQRETQKEDLSLKPTARVVAGSQEDTSGSLAKANDMTGSRGGENAVLADDELLDAVGGTNLGN